MKPGIFVLPGILSVALSGCFSGMVRESISSRQYDIDHAPDSIQVVGAQEPRLVHCPRVAPQVFRMALGSDTFFLHVRAGYPRAILCDASPFDSATATLPSDQYRLRSCLAEPTGESDPMDAVPALDVVVATRPVEVQPSDSAGRPSLALLLVESPSRGGADSAWISENRASLYFSSHGSTHWVPLQARTNRRKHGQREAVRQRKLPLYAVAVPADVVTAPVVLPVALIVALGQSIAVVGLGGHPW